MKKRTVWIVIAALLVSLLIWRFWPHSASILLPDSESVITSFFANATAFEFENGEHHFIRYAIEENDPPTEDMEALLDILKTSRYQQDLRNLLPWGRDVVGSTSSNGDTHWSITLDFCIGEQKPKLLYIHFMGRKLVYVSTGNSSRIYHPTNPEAIDALVEYLQTHGEKK